MKILTSPKSCPKQKKRNLLISLSVMGFFSKGTVYVYLIVHFDKG
uniref:Uncharacterized protein n=1 Tax=Rhizophora mucronata TaxID=61149 RepID=A0A2P2N479_RHIMU